MGGQGEARGHLRELPGEADVGGEESEGKVVTKPALNWYGDPLCFCGEELCVGLVGLRERSARMEKGSTERGRAGNMSRVPCLIWWARTEEQIKDHLKLKARLRERAAKRRGARR